MDTDPGRDLLATVRGGARSEVRLFSRGGREEEWSVKLDGDWREVAIAGDVVVVGGNASGMARRCARSLSGTGTSAGRRRLRSRALRCRRQGPSPLRRRRRQGPSSARTSRVHGWSGCGLPGR